MTDDLDYWGQPDGIGALPHARAGGRAADGALGLGTVWLAPIAGPSPSKVRRFYRRHPHFVATQGTRKGEVAL